MAKLSSEVRALVKAMRDDDPDTVSAALDGGLHPDAPLPGGITVLMAACREGKQGVIPTLLAHGADPNARDEQGDSPLGWTVTGRYLKSLDRLIDRGGLWFIDRLFSGGDLLSGKVEEFGEIDEQRARSAATIVQTLLDHGGIARTANSAGETPLMLASESGFAQAVAALVKGGSSVHTEDHTGRTAFDRAVEAGRWDVVATLAGIDPGVLSGPSGGAALLRATDSGRAASVEHLLAVTPGQLEPEVGQAVLEWACRERHPGIVAKTLERLPGVPVPAAALIAASAGGDLEIVDAILAAGASPDGADDQGATPLMAAHPRVVRRLIAGGAGVDARSNAGWTPLLGAASRHDVFTMAQLIAAGADLRAETAEGESAAALAEKERYRLREAGRRDWDGYAAAGMLRLAADVAEAEAAGGNPGGKADGQPLVLAAARLGRLELVRRLVAAGAEVDVRGKEGETPLMAAAEWGHAAVVAELLSAGADVEARSEEGETPLMWAATADIVRLLADAGADPNARDGRSRTVLHNLLASSPGPLAGESTGPRRRVVPDHSEVIRALAIAGADIDARDADGRTPLVAAVDPVGPTGAPPGPAARALLEAGADPDLADENGRTALIAAAARCDPAILVMLIEAGAALDARDGKGRTALKVARSTCGSEKPKQVLMEAGAAE